MSRVFETAVTGEPITFDGFHYSDNLTLTPHDDNPLWVCDDKTWSTPSWKHNHCFHLRVQLNNPLVLYVKRAVERLAIKGTWRRKHDAIIYIPTADAEPACQRQAIVFEPVGRVKVVAVTKHDTERPPKR
jgi:hypothetical protein